MIEDSDAMQVRFDFSGKTVVVTGSARGIGRRIGERFYAVGANVAFCSKSPEGKEELMQEVAGDDRSRIMAQAADVASVADIDRFFDAVVQRFGAFDILVNNAGIMTSEGVCDITEEQWQRVMDTNLKSMLFASQWFARYHRQRLAEPGKEAATPAGGQPCIVNIASVSSVTCIPDNLLYNLSKAGVVTLTKTLARGLGPDGIRVNAVGPGSTPTDLNAALYADPQRERDLCAKLPLGRRANKDDIADSVLYLASDAADYLTGQVVYAEGGWLLV